MLVRLAIVIVALGAVVLLASSRSHFDACQGARTTVFGVTLGKRPVTDQAAALRTIRTECRDGSALAFASAALQRQGRTAQAVRYARLATRREPDNVQGWSALAVAARRSDPGLARRAQARSLALSPIQ